MSNSFRRDASTCQVQTVSHADDAQGKLVSLSLIRAAIDASGWKHEALAAEMRLPNAAYLSRMLSGEKPWTLRHIESLPDGIEAIYYRLRSESLGLLVVEPVDYETARRHLVSGLVGVLTSAILPAKADRMVRAELPTKARRQA